MKSVLQNDICTPMFTAGTFTVTNIRKPGKCPTTDEWITNVCVCVCVYYPALNAQEIRPLAAKQMNLEDLLNHINQTQKDRMISLIYRIQKLNT